MNKYDLMLIDASPNQPIKFRGFKRKENNQKILRKFGLGNYGSNENLRPKNGLYIKGDIPYEGTFLDFFNKIDLREIKADDYTVTLVIYYIYRLITMYYSF